MALATFGTPGGEAARYSYLVLSEAEYLLCKMVYCLLCVFMVSGRAVEQQASMRLISEDCFHYCVHVRISARSQCF
jgi:hypothetical protein